MQLRPPHVPLSRLPEEQWPLAKVARPACAAQRRQEIVRVSEAARGVLWSFGCAQSASLSGAGCAASRTQRTIVVEDRQHGRGRTTERHTTGNAVQREDDR